MTPPPGHIRSDGRGGLRGLVAREIVLAPVRELIEEVLR